MPTSRSHRPAALAALTLVPLLLLAPTARGQGSGTSSDSFPLPNRPVSRIVAPRWIAEEERDGYGEADRVLRVLQIGPGARVADIGAGDGYYVAALAARVGPTGMVYGEDIEPRYLRLLRNRQTEEGWKNVQVIEGTAGDPKLPPGSIDVALMIHMYHEISAPFELLHRLAPAFRAGGRLAILDVDAPTDRHGTPPRLLVCELQAMGYLRVRREEMADGAYLMIFSAPDAMRRTTSAADVRTRVAQANCRA
jgi:SAM-dependent methyltransferase